MQMLLPLFGGCQQLCDRAVEGNKFDLVAHGQREKPRIRDLTMAAQSTGAGTEHLLKPEIQREKTVPGMRRIAQQQLGNFAHPYGPPRKGGLRDDANESRLVRAVVAQPCRACALNQRIIRSWCSCVGQPKAISALASSR